MNSHVHLWQSPFLKYFTSQQHHRWFRSRAASSVLVNVLALFIVALERHWRSFHWLFPSLEKYSSYHSQICLAVIALLVWNILDFGIRYLYCCYKLSRKFVVNSEVEKLDLAKSFQCAATSSLVTVRRTSPPATSSPRTASPLDSVYLPSASPASARHQQQQKLQPHLLSTPGRCTGGYRGGNLSAGNPNDNDGSVRHVASFGSSSSGDLSVYFSPPRNLSALSTSLLLGGSGGVGGSGSHHSVQHPQHHHNLDDFSYLSRLRYQLGTPSPSRLSSRSRNSAASPYPAESIISLMSPPGAAPTSEQQQQQQHDQLAEASKSSSSTSWTRLTPEQTSRVLGIDRELACIPRGLDRWLQGIRAWLHGTLIEPLSRDVDQANARLREAGASPEMLVGQASLAQLQAASASGSAAAAVAPWARTLAPLLPYLQACEDQGYLVRRLAELTRLPCLGAYRWDSGSPDRWIAERHPSDARLLMSLLCAYLDRCLPPLPGNHRPFSSVFLTASAADQLHHGQHQHPCQQLAASSPAATAAAASTGPSVVGGMTQPLSTSTNPTIAASAIAAASAGVELRILPASRQPPHYQLLLTTQQQKQHQLTAMDIAPGSRNFFYCVLFFFYYYFSQRGGRLRQVSLGESGLNLDWIFRSGGGAGGDSGRDIEDLLLPPSK